MHHPLYTDGCSSWCSRYDRLALQDPKITVHQYRLQTCQDIALNDAIRSRRFMSGKKLNWALHMSGIDLKQSDVPHIICMHVHKDNTPELYVKLE